MPEYRRGDDYKEKGDDFKTYGITQEEPFHGNKIVVYEDWKLRNKILKLLKRKEIK